MDQQTKFKTALAALAASAETKDRKLTKADVKEFLEDMDLGEMCIRDRLLHIRRDQHR